MISTADKLTRDELVKWLYIFINRLSWCEGMLSSLQMHDVASPFLPDDKRELLNSVFEALEKDREENNSALDVQNYWQQVARFNSMYKLPISAKPEAPSDESLVNFKSILAEEVDEVDDIIAEKDPLERAVMLSDWLCDIIVYCSTKANMHGIPTPQILDIIMRSNFSKLGADGLPIYDERGKVMKGPNYWKPEPEIRKLLEVLGGNNGRDRKENL